MSRRKINEKFLNILRFSLCQLFILTISIFCLRAENTNAQKVLSLPVTVSADNTALKKVLNDIEKQVNVQFTFSQEVVDTKQKVSLHLKNIKLKDVLDKLFLPIRVKYSVFNEKTIVLKADQNFIKSYGEATLPPVKGRILDKNGDPLIGASVQVKGSQGGVVTDLDGYFEIDAKPGDVLLIVYTGYANQEVEVSDKELVITLEESADLLEDVVVLGSRSTAGRSRTETVAPVDVLTSKDMIATGQTEPAQMMHFIAPSFNSSRQTVADGTDHIDPATLRGLGPDQVLLLLNGKRRHNQALININGTVGRGSVGTDLNAIPAAAIERLEVLRDGASSQYGSDAIAGVINVVMKNSVGTSFTAHYGSYNTQYEPIFGKTDKRKMVDGQTLQLSAYHGLKLGEKGKLSFALEFRDRKPSNRVGDYTGRVFNNNAAIDDSLINVNGGFDRSFNMLVGNAASQNILGSVNLNLPIGQKTEFYVNGNFANRRGFGKGFYRYPRQTTQVINELYPKGFLPEIHSSINDISGLFGVKGTFGNGWQWDLSDVIGSNNFNFNVKNSNNASQFAEGAKAQTEFDAGTLNFTQNTLNLDISKAIETKSLKSLNVAFGAEHRIDFYNIQEGEEASWKNYALNATPLRVGGSQVFPGFQPSNAVNESRNIIAAYADIESDITSKLLVNGAVRVENYSDFGANVAGKLAARFKIADELVFRGAVSNGFRAPSIHQRYFSNTSTQFLVLAGQTVPNNVGTFRNDGPIARALGIPELGAEKSTNLSFGVTSKIANSISLTIDAYQIDIKNRVVLTGNLSRSNAVIGSLLDAANIPKDVTTIAFFTNAIDTRTKGLDVVLSSSNKIGSGQLDFTAGANFNSTSIIGSPKTTDKLPADAFGKTFFSRVEESRIVAGQPRKKISLSLNYKIGNLNAMLRGTNFGQVEIWDPVKPELDEIQTPKTVIDMSLGYKFANKFTLTLGANNLSDVYPDKIKNAANSSDSRFIYSRNVTQFGFGGRYLFAGFRVDI